MGERLIMIITQPCVLCQGPLEEWHVYASTEDAPTERWEIHPQDHQCDALAALVAERRGHRPQAEKEQGC
jgi:hypothetical protein